MNLSPEIVIVSGDKSTLIHLNLRPVFGEDYTSRVRKSNPFAPEFPFVDFDLPFMRSPSSN
jgi:hypothetical protein